MSDPQPPYDNPPIVEALVDFDFDLPPGFDFTGVAEDFAAEVSSSFPDWKERRFQAMDLSTPAPGGAPSMAYREGLEAFQFFAADGLQLLQLRPRGFTFNRLKPYTSLDHYHAVIELGWKAFHKVAEPILLRRIALRMINRISIPLTDGSVALSDYLAIGPQLPPKAGLIFGSFFNRHEAFDTETGNALGITLATQGQDGRTLTLLFDNEASRPLQEVTPEWSRVLEILESLRKLKNFSFETTLTSTCRNLFS